MIYFLFFEPHRSPEVVIMGPILQVRKLRPGDMSSLAQTTWPVRYLPRPSIQLLPAALLFLPQKEPLCPLLSVLGLRDNSFLPGL